MTRDNSDIGRRAQQAGSNFESWIEVQHQKAEMLGILAHVEHSEPHAKMIGGRLIYASPGTADFFGTLDRTAISYACEAKSTSQNRLPKSAVEPKQQRHLEAVARAGGLALLVVEFRFVAQMSPHTLRSRFAVPWLKINWEIRRTKESIGPNDIDAWHITSVPGDGDCFLSRFHAPGPKTGAGSGPARRFARE